MIREGDIVEIPLPDGRTAIGWILHISKRFKDAVGFIAFGIKGQLRDDVVIDSLTGNPSSMTVLGPLYTHIDNLIPCSWQVIAHQPISEKDRMLTKRKVGGGVYVYDDYIGSTEELGEQNLRPMLVMGMPVVYMEIEKAFGKEDESSGRGHKKGTGKAPVKAGDE
jgi:hypothetical protein